jgi:hypothetical protein
MIKPFPSDRIAMAAKANKSVTVEQIRDAIHKLKKNSLQFDYVNFNKSKRSTEAKFHRDIEETMLTSLVTIAEA